MGEKVMRVKKGQGGPSLSKSGGGNSSISLT